MQQPDSVDISRDLSLSMCPQKKAGVLAQSVLEEMVLYDDESEMGFSLNASARSIWDLCDGGRSLKAICEEIGNTLNIETSLLHEDVKKTVGELIALGLLHLEDDSDSISE